MDDYEAIRRVIALYAQLLDDRRWDDLAGLFCADGILPWAGNTFHGRAEIAEGLPATQPATPAGIKHFVFSPVIELAGSEATAWSDVIVALVRATGGPGEMSFVGRYHDRLRREEDGRWRFQSHVTVATGEAVPENEAPPPAH